VDTYVDEKGAVQAERRKSNNLRALFDDVVRRVEPFFQEGGELNGSRADFWMVRTISDAYPDLNNEEAHLLANAAVRYYRQRRLVG
jgi:hypothetical protein